MALSKKARDTIAKISKENTKLGDIKKIAKEIKKDHELALELWSSQEHYPRLLATLIMDKKLLTEDIINMLAKDMQRHTYDQSNQMADWLMANQLMKDKNTIALMETWEDDASPILQRLFWYYQARLRWTGQAPPKNTPDLMTALEKNMGQSKPKVQWAMNFCAGQIGVHEPKYRSRCVKLGKKLGLYKDEVVAKGCTPSYLPEFIRIEAAKHNK